MDLFQAMQIFQTVAAEGSMSAAARRMSLSKAMISRTVADLEDRLGARLLNRTTRQLALTDAGADYLAHVQDIMERNEEAECRLSETARRATGTLRINAPVNFGTRTLAPLLPAFLAEHPDVAVELDLTDRFVDLVEEGVDLVIRIGEALPETAIARRIGEITHHFIAAPSLVEARGAPRSIADIADWPRVVYPQRGLPKPLETRGARVVARSNGGEALALLVEAGLGFGYLPDFIVDEGIAAGRLVRLLENEAADASPIHALWPHRRHMTFRTRAFVDFLVANRNG